MNFTAVPVAKPLGAVKKMCSAGHVVVFDDDGSYIFNKYTGEVNMMREDQGNYIMDVQYRGGGGNRVAPEWVSA